MITKLDDIEVGEALPVGVKGTAATLALLAGSTLVGRIAVNGGTPTEVPGAAWYLAPDADGFIGHVAFAGTLITAAGSVAGVVVITKDGQPWSPMKIRFETKAKAHV